jgi:tetratricopeptide (TPR) repeat protein
MGLLIITAVCPAGKAFGQSSLDYYNQGIEYLRRGFVQEAANNFEKAVYLNPQYAAAFAALGTAYHAMERYEEAVNACKKAIELQPGMVDPYITMGSSHFLLGNPDEAMTAYKKAIDLNPNIPEAYYGLAQIYQLFGNPKQAKENGAKAIDLFAKRGNKAGAEEVENFLQTIRGSGATSTTE